MRPLTLLIVAACLAGCGSVKFKGDGAKPGSVSVERWPFVPVSMRIHPFTALTFEEGSGKFIMEARVELLDTSGDTTKGIGQLRFELYARRVEASRAGEEQRIELWGDDITTVAQNNTHYDAVTRTYLFLFELTQPPPKDRSLRLFVQFDPVGGKRMTAERPMEFTQSPPGGDAGEQPGDPSEK